MNKKRAIILITILIVLIAGALVYSYLYLLPEGELPGQGKGFGSFFPQNETSESNIPDGEFAGEGELPGEGGGVIIPDLRHITIEPISGMTSFLFSESTTTPERIMFRYVERATGHIFDVREDSISPVRVSNTTVPAIEEALFISPNTVVMRYLKDDNETIETYLASLQKNEAGEYEKLEGIFLSQDIKDIAVSQDARMFYISKTEEGSTGTVYDSETGDSEVIFSSLLSEWLPVWENSNIHLMTKASSESRSHVFSLNPQNGQMSKLFGDRVGLSIMPNPFNNNILYSEIESGIITFGVYITSERGSNVVSVGTLAEKCVWAEESLVYCGVPASLPSRSLPETWYQGKVHFTDNIWKIDLDSGIFEIIATSLNDAGEDLDVFKPQVTPDGKYLLFVNKRDHTLWSLRLKADLPEVSEEDSEETEE